MPDYIIASVSTPDGLFSTDMELPATIPLSRFAESLLDTLKQLCPKVFGPMRTIALYVDDVGIEGGKSLSDYGVWDGGELIAKEK